MAILLSVLIIFILAITLKKSIKQHYIPILTFVIIVNIVSFLFPNFELFYFINEGFIGLAFWIVVMFSNTPLTPLFLKRSLMLVRKELSIFAFIFTLTHAIYDFSIIFNLSYVSSYIAMLIMIPLFITSFEYYRKKMPYAKWKAMQNYSYIAYGLILIHLIAITRELQHLIVYLFIFIIYFISKLFKAKAIHRIIFVLFIASSLVIGYKQFGELVSPTQSNTSAVNNTAISINTKLSDNIDNDQIEEIPEDTLPSIEEEIKSISDNMAYIDGEYVTSVDAYGPDLTVQTIITNNLISSISIVSHNEKKSRYYQPAFDQTPADIIEGPTNIRRGH